MTTVSDKDGVICPHCGTYNTHEECGTYEAWFPSCKNCQECTEADPMVDFDIPKFRQLNLAQMKRDADNLSLAKWLVLGVIGICVVILGCVIWRIL